MTVPLGRIAGRFWRMHVPRWARQPLSGEGARRFGGRWNAEGRPALYLASTYRTAIEEVHRTVVQPGTLVPYDVEADGIADLTNPEIANSVGLTPALWDSDWRFMWRGNRQRPPTWDIADRLIEMGAAGILVPSFAGPDTNLVLWRWNEGGVRVEVRDPGNLLSANPFRRQ